MPFLELFTIFFTLKGLGGSFNAVFSKLGIAEYHGPAIGAVIAILMSLACWRFARGKISKPCVPLSSKTKVLVVVAFALLITAGIAVRIKKMNELPIDEGRADMLVTIRSMIQDYTTGRDPYLPYTTGSGRTLQRFYLPPLWLSYTPFYLAGTDIRYFNILAQTGVLLLLLALFFSNQSLNPVVFLISIALFCFSKQKIYDVIDIQTGAFWISYATVLWAEMTDRKWLSLVMVPLVLTCRHPAVLLFLPFFLFLFLKDRKYFLKQILVIVVLTPLLIFPFMKDPRNILDCIFFYVGSLNSSSLEVTSMFYGLSSILQRTHAIWLQKPLQLVGLAFGLWAVWRTPSLNRVQSLALGGIAYIFFMLFVSSTPQYIWAEPLILIYFLMLVPSPR